MTELVLVSFFVSQAFSCGLQKNNSFISVCKQLAIILFLLTVISRVSLNLQYLTFSIQSFLYGKAQSKKAQKVDVAGQHSVSQSGH